MTTFTLTAAGFAAVVSFTMGPGPIANIGGKMVNSPGIAAVGYGRGPDGDVCHNWCRPADDMDEFPGRVCDTALEAGGSGWGGPYADCDTEMGVEELCELAYGQPDCTDCDYTHCEGGGNFSFSPSGSVLSRGNSIVVNGAIRVVCNGFIAGYTGSSVSRTVVGDSRIMI
jgi:hypothetical protein